MSRVIEQERLESGDLTEEEQAYLVQRDVMPKSVRDELRMNPDAEEEVRALLGVPPDAVPVHQVANTGDVNTPGYTVEELERMLEIAKAGSETEEADAARQQMLEELAEADYSTGANWDQDVDGGGEYDDGWNNDRRRGELSKRGLVIDGSKQEMIERLVRSDNDELVEGDEPDEDDEDGDADEDEEG